MPSVNTIQFFFKNFGILLGLKEVKIKKYFKKFDRFWESRRFFEGGIGSTATAHFFLDQLVHSSLQLFGRQGG